MTLPTDLLPDDEFDRLARFVAGEGTERERAEVTRWIAESPARQEALRDLEEAWEVSADAAPPDVDAAWMSLAGRLETATIAPRNDLNDAKVLPMRRVQPIWRSTGVLMRVAAAAVLVVGIGVLWPQMRKQTAENATVAAATSEMRTGVGEHRTIPLPDGSEVVLGPTSTLTVTEGYAASGAGLREVTLRGEALFRVTHDEARPFRVVVGGGVVEDLGTEFAVRAYPADSAVRVAVASGSVAVKRTVAAAAEAILQPRDVATMRDTGGVAVERGVDVSTYTAFADGRLIFNDTPLSDVALALARWYGVEVRISEKGLRDRHYTGAFESESLDEVLRVIGMTLDIRYRRGEGWVEFTSAAGGSAKSGVGSPVVAPPRIEAGV